MEFNCTCKNFTGYAPSEVKIAEAMGIPVEVMHNFMDKWEDTFAETHDE